MATRKEISAAVGQRYRHASRGEKAQILDEFVALTNYHRKYAIRLLNRVSAPHVAVRSPRNRIYDEAVRQALVVLWEAADRICGKRLRALIPLLIEAMERHGHLDVDPLIKAKLLRISAATIDRLLAPTRQQLDGQRRRRTGVGAAIRRRIPVRTFADWRDPPPGFFEVDMVEHCGGPKHDGNFVHSLVLTDIATGWTECVALPVRNQALVVQGFAKVATDIPFPMRGIDTDNDSAFMNQTVFDYCKAHHLEQTRSRAYKKNDQAWVEQKNGAIVRRLVGYGRLSGMAATQALAQLYTAARLYTNFFQPCFKLKSKHRDGARVVKTYYPPQTPCERLLALPEISASTKAALLDERHRLDPVRLLHDIRNAQRVLAEFSTSGARSSTEHVDQNDVASFLESLATAWEHGEVRPTHRRPSRPNRWWRTRDDPFEHAWPLVEHWLGVEPTISAKTIMARLAATMPDVYAGTTQLRTLQRRIKDWRTAQAKALVLGYIHDNDDLEAIASRSQDTGIPISSR